MIKKLKTKEVLLISCIFCLFSPPLWAQYAGGTGTVDDPFLVATAEQMNAIGLHQGHWNKHFKQIADIDLGIYAGQQFNLISVYGTDPFTGTFDGDGFEIRNFTFQSGRDRVGLFESLERPGELRNIIMIDPVIECPQSVTVGALVAGLGEGIIRDCTILGGKVVGDWGVGGFVGQTWAGSDTPINIINCHVTSEIFGNRDVGGIVGSNFGRVHNCSSSGQVTGTRHIGGLVGSNSYSAPWSTAKGEIVNSYSTCLVSGSTNVGGLCGSSGDQTMIVNCYSTGHVTGDSSFGGLLGDNSGITVSGCFWDLQTSGLSVSAGGTGLATAQMQDPATYRDAGWDLQEIWVVEEGDYPTLQWESVYSSPQKPTVVQAEDAAIEGGMVQDVTSGYKGAGYVNLPAEVDGSVEWIVPVSSSGTRTLCLRYANGTNQDEFVQISVNGVVICSRQVFQSTGAWDVWNSTDLCAYLNSGGNEIKLTTASPFAGLYFDEMEILGTDTDLVFQRDVIFSSQQDDCPAVNAIDANSSTCWIASGYPQWIEVDLGFVHVINQTQLTCMNDRAYQFKIEAGTSLDGSYVLVVDRSNNEKAGRLDYPIMDTFEATPARYVRLTITGASDYTGTEVGIAEFSVFGVVEVPAITIGAQGYPTIQSAINAAEGGETIILNPGLYCENIRISNKTVLLRSVDPNDPDYVNSTIIQADMNEPLLSLGEYTWACEIAGLTLKGGSVGVIGTAANAKLRNCNIMDNLNHGMELFQVSSPHLLDCLIAGNGRAGIKMHATTGGRMPLYCEPLIESCTIIDNGESGIVGGKPVILNSVIQEP
ncbi:MAG: GLUG motif-containing protein [Planctomycetota bacterium]